MVRERIIRLVAGTFILASLALGLLHSPYWFIFTGFVGLNLFQSALTGWCLMDDILRKAKVKSEAEMLERGKAQLA
jgi:hypothetical protein